MRLWAGMVCGWLVAAALLLCCGPTRAAEAVRLEGEAHHFSLDGSLELYADDSGGLTLDEVIRRHQFRDPGPPRLDPGIRWYRVTVQRQPGMPAEWVLAFGEPDVDDVRAYLPRPEGGFEERHLGRRVPAEQLPLSALRHMVRVTLPEGEPVTLYLRLASLHKIRVEEVALWRPDALMFAEAREAALFGLRFGMLLLVIVGYGLAGLWVRDVPMLLYALYVGTVLSRGITHTALVTLLFPSAGGTVNYLLGAIGLLGALSSFVFLWDRILDLRKTMPFMHRIYVAVGVLSLLSLLLTSSPLFSIVAVSSLALMLAASLTSVVLAAIMVRREPGNVLLKFYLVAFLPLIAVAAAHVAFPLLPMVPVGLGRNLDGFAVTTHIAVLGVALVYRLGRIQHAHAKVQAELLGERKVQQRLRAFVDMVTHEFKTPLAVIDSAVQVLELKTASQPELGGRLTTIRQAVKRLVGLIETCLAGQRYETTEIKLARISPAAIAEMAAERNHMQDRQAIGVATRDLPDACMADGELLGIALDTLIDNAYRYGPVDQQVEVTAESFGGWVSFAVHDRGPGVPAGEERRIFEKYYRCPSTANVAGNGIGLHLVKTIAELHGGRAAYAPRPGGGASFSLTIPGAESAEAELGGYYG